MIVSKKIKLLPSNYYAIDLNNQEYKELSKNENKRVILRSGIHQLHIEIKSRNGNNLLYMNKKFIKQLDINDGDEIEFEILIDDSKYQFFVCEEFEEVFKTDPEALEIFESFTSGKKRSILHQVNSATSVDKRIERALRVANNLKIGFTDLKELIGG